MWPPARTLVMKGAPPPLKRWWTSMIEEHTNKYKDINDTQVSERPL